MSCGDATGGDLGCRCRTRPGARCAEAAAARPRHEDGTLARGRTSGAAAGDDNERKPGKARESAATATGTNRGAAGALRDPSWHHRGRIERPRNDEPHNPPIETGSCTG